MNFFHFGGYEKGFYGNKILTFFEYLILIEIAAMLIIIDK